MKPEEEEAAWLKKDEGRCEGCGHLEQFHYCTEDSDLCSVEIQDKRGHWRFCCCVNYEMGRKR